MTPGIRFQQEANGAKHVWLDSDFVSIEISDLVKSFTLHAGYQDSYITLEIAQGIPANAEIESGQVRVDATTKIVLEHLGWTAPPDAESRREQATRRLGGIK